MNTITTPVEIGARGLVKKGIEECINKIHGNIKIQKFQKCVLLGTARIRRRSLSTKLNKPSHPYDCPGTDSASSVNGAEYPQTKLLLLPLPPPPPLLLLLLIIIIMVIIIILILIIIELLIMDL